MSELNERLAKAIGDSCPIGGSTPDFTNSMDACIKWIVPILHAPVEIGNIKMKDGTKGWCCRIGNSGWQQAESVSLAFCLAAIKYFEEVHKC
jgi:hypothetical protein